MGIAPASAAAVYGSIMQVIFPIRAAPSPGTVLHLMGVVCTYSLMTVKQVPLAAGFPLQRIMRIRMEEAFISIVCLMWKMNGSLMARLFQIILPV